MRLLYSHHMLLLMFLFLQFFCSDVVGQDPGTIKWEFLTGGSVSSSPAIGPDGTIHVGSDDDSLYAINPDGTKKWELVTGVYMTSSVALGIDGTVYVGSWDEKLYTIFL